MAASALSGVSLLNRQRPRGLVATVLVFLCACGTSRHDDASRSEGDGEPVVDASSPPCTSEPRLLVDYVAALRGSMPDAGVSYAAPSVGVTATDLLYLIDLQSPHRGLLMRAPIRGGKPSRLARLANGGSASGQRLLVTATAAVYSEITEPDDSAGAIVRVDLGGGTRQVLAVTRGIARSLVADEQNVYFIDDDGTKSVPLAGGLEALLTTEVAHWLGLDGPLLLFADSSDPGRVFSTPVGGGDVTVLADQQPHPMSPIACGPDVCWLNLDSSMGVALGATLMRVSLDGGEPRSTGFGASRPIDVRFDDGAFYITSRGGISRIPATGGATSTLARGLILSGPVFDSTCVYWADVEGIYSQAKE